MKKFLIMSLMFGSLVLPVAALSCGCGGNSYRTTTGPVSQQEAQQITERYLASIDNGTLHAGKIQLEGNAYLAEILNDQNKTVAKMSIDALTGDIRPIF